MVDVTLSAAVRSSLLALQNTTDLIDRTQGRLSTGLRVASAIDDPVAFFQAKSLNDRASDFNEKKDGIDQGLSSLTSAVDGIEGIENIVRQLKGVASSMKSATGTQFTDLISQFNSLRTQIGLLADDSEYQGTNLINNTTETLTISFSAESASQITINAVNVRESGLGVGDAAAATGTSFNYTAASSVTLSSAGATTITLTYQGSAQTLATDATAIALKYGTATVSVSVSTATTQSTALTNGQTLTLKVYASGTEGEAATAGLYLAATTASLTTVEAEDTSFIQEGNTTQINAVISSLDSALSTLRSQAQTLGSNVALLQTRLDFTQNYVNTLELGSSKLTLADINEEGANLLALQTRQQLGISALSFAGQAEQGILSLFR